MIVTIILVVAKFLRDTSAEGEGEGKEKREKPQGAKQTKSAQHTTEPPAQDPHRRGFVGASSWTRLVPQRHGACGASRSSQS